MCPWWGSMMNDGNNTVNSWATLKINWRAEVKHLSRRRVLDGVRCDASGKCGIAQFAGQRIVRVILNSLSRAREACGASWYRTSVVPATTSGILSGAPAASTSREEPVMAKGKRTFQPNNRRRARVHGFRLRMRTRAGRGIVGDRRRKGRSSLTA